MNRKPNFRSGFDLLIDGHEESASGKYNHFDWTLRVKGDTGDWTAKIASIHETCHADLNHSTAFGLLLVSLSYLAREEGTETQFNQTLRALTESCRNTHEIYATFISLVVAKDLKITVKEFEKTFPLYETYLVQADDLLVGINSRFVRMHALAGLIKLCFQTPIIVSILEGGLSNFSVGKFRAQEYPDKRLQTVSTLVSAKF